MQTVVRHRPQRSAPPRNPVTHEQWVRLQLLVQPVAGQRADQGRHEEDEADLREEREVGEALVPDRPWARSGRPEYISPDAARPATVGAARVPGARIVAPADAPWPVVGRRARRAASGTAPSGSSG